MVIDLVSGWNMIAGPSWKVPLDHVFDPGVIIIPGTLYGFDGTYFISDTIKPGIGYWLRASEAGQVTIIRGEKPSEQPPGAAGGPLDLSRFACLHIADAHGYQRDLYFNDSESAIEELENPHLIDSYSLPPLSNKTVFDARYIGDYRFCEESEVSFTIQAVYYPLQIKISNLATNLTHQHVLLEMSGDNVIKRYPLIPEMVVTINGSSGEDLRLFKIVKAQKIPDTFALEQNYPNPFNPETTIKYALPQNLDVTIAVYNSLGQRISILVDELIPAGYHEVHFDGSKFASGIYFYRIKAGNFSDIKKMLLLK